jgi:hypothetical protein
MYNPQLIWYNKKDVLDIFPITERTYFRKIKGVNSDIRTKTLKNRKGKNTTLIHYKDLEKLFPVKRVPSNLNDKEQVRKYVGTSSWTFMGNIKPAKTKKTENIAKMKFLYLELKKLDKKITLFYHLEENPKDDFYHSHFLVHTTLDQKTIIEKLNLISENDKRIDLQSYDFQTYHYRGSFYSNKFGKHDTKYFNPFVYWELLR